MENKKINFDLVVMQKAVKEAVRAKAMQFGSSIIYMKDGVLVEENPRAATITTLDKKFSN